MASEEGERWVGATVDFSEGISRATLRWVVDNLLCAGDHLLLHVLNDPSYEQGKTLLWEATGSRCGGGESPMERSL
ncbi:hypothetical protein GUJ93_ZPchr0002g23367 [Zizania palustris]|uniref:UspA domain-containing protein n=1 Tax=Zizania palustris TaxID=103762 RepID=A0A8J5V5B3_ZIZPA|nr:hypothetical protein GUJ93_ZPchr0002g23367 [Zizania palustris]